MEIAVISDIHSNLVAFEAVLADMPPVDTTICAGDVVGYGPQPAECLEIVRDREIPTVMGNHDRGIATDSAFAFNSMAKAGVQYSREQLSQDAIDWLYDLPTERHEFDGRVTIVHGHPDDPDRYTYPRMFSAEMLGEGRNSSDSTSGRSPRVDVLVMGHTHVQAHEVFDEGIVMNPGSVGQPRDGDPRAAYAILDLDAMTVEEHRVEYDIDLVEHQVAQAGLPEQIGSRLHQGR